MINDCFSSAHDSISKDQVVLKKIAKPFDNVAILKRTFREVHLLNGLRHENVCKDQRNGDRG